MAIKILNSETALDERTKSFSSAPPRFGGRDENDNLVRLMLGVAWRNRKVTVPLAVACLALPFAAQYAVQAGGLVYFWLIAGFVFLLGLLVAITLQLRAWVVELSQQILDVADGASKPPEGAVMTALELEAEIERLRSEVDRLKREVAGFRD